MLDTLTTARDALARNDADTLETLCSGTMAVISPGDAVACREALRVFRRQVIAARVNLVVRQRLLASRSAQEGSWAP